MEKRLITFIILAVSFMFAADVFGGHSLDDANKLSQETNKPILIKFDAKWCPNCRQMDRVTFSDQKIIEKLDDFAPVKIDVDTKSGNSLANDYKVTAIPTIVVLGQDGKVIYQQAGYQDPGTFAETLNNVLYSIKEAALVEEVKEIPTK